MPLWIPITIAAALCQNIRTTMQQKIRGILSVDGANFVRYLYGAPLALGMLAFLVFGTGRQVPPITLAFLGLVTIAGVAQIVATSLMIHAFCAAQLRRRHGLFQDRDGVRGAVRHLHRPRAAEASAPGWASWSAWAASRS